MKTEDLEIINQLEVDLNQLDKAQLRSCPETNVKAAMNGIRDGNYRFACERLAIAIENIIMSDW